MESSEKQKIAEIQKQKEIKIRKSLDASVKDAMAYNVMQGSGINFINAFAVALKASNFQISLLTSLPQLLAAWIQLFSAGLLEKFKSRKKPISIFVLLQACCWIPLLLVPFIFLGETAVWFVILFYTLFTIFGAIIGPIWQSLMGDLVPTEERGAYFGKRTAAAGIMTLLSTMIAGYYLNLYPKDLAVYGFAALFFISFLMRMISRHYLNKMFEPQFLPNQAAQFSFQEFVKKMRSNNFGNFVIFVSLFSLAINIASPFFTVYQLRVLGFDYLTFTIITIASLISGLFVMTQWGKITDKFGNWKVMSICGVMICAIPLYWFLFKDPLILFACEFFISGIFWAGFNLAAANFLYDTTTPEKRTRCAAYYNVFNGTGVFIGALIGGILATLIPDNFLFSTNLLWIFAICFFARILVFIIFIRRVKEARPVEKTEDKKIYYDVIIKNDFTGFGVELITTLATTAKKSAGKIKDLPKFIEEEIEEIDERVEKTVEKLIAGADKIVKRKKK